ncbi:PREDICTED: cell division protein FtsY homolog, chloroplastic isoform X2 [Theobroma cacao]|uniref:Cell division protein FtsY homolog, chloroplastic isoform X2 n=1 Tax=Theobroma cacao TaxID=3641 RepID=A0AB32X1S1_THECC|nr:PREDICTED: cell division protein FtsY homolog, chloroplastic isoform X2 [Theobroma cacao]
MAFPTQLSLISKPSPLFSNLPRTRFNPSTTARPTASRFKCLASQTGFFTRLGRLIKEKAKSDVEKIFSGFSKTRDNLAVIDELLLYWNLADTDRVLDELEEALLVSDFGPRITIKIVESLREDILSGKLKSGSEIKDALKKCVLDLLTKKGSKTELRLGFRKPAVIMIVGVNGGGKTTSLGKLAYRLKNEGAKILMAAGDTFRAAASDQLEIWAERTGCEIVVAEKENAKASSGLHTNFSLMEELIACKKAVGKVIPGAPNEILLVLDGNTGLNMLPQAREFNEVVGITGFVLTKLDGSARGGCVVSVVDELGIPVKFLGVGEGLEDLQPFDAEAFVNAIFPLRDACCCKRLSHKSTCWPASGIYIVQMCQKASSSIVIMQNFPLYIIFLSCVLTCTDDNWCKGPWILS